MGRKPIPTIIFLILFLILPGTAAASDPTPTYTVGVVPQFEIRRIREIWEPILAAVSDRTGIGLTLVGAPGIPEFEAGFTAGAFDFAYMNPYHLIVANREQGYRPLVRDVGRTLYGIIVVRKESPLQEVAELDGKTIAFPAPNALGAALIPRAEFARKFHIDVTPRYVKSRTSVYLNVVTRRTDAGGGVQKTLEQQDRLVRDALRVLYRTGEVAPHPLAVHARVDTSVAEAVQRAFLELGASDEGRDLLAEVPIRRIGRATLEDYAPLAEMGLDDFYVRERVP
jgi:phosphonate transport system substrate-binding protein